MGHDQAKLYADLFGVLSSNLEKSNVDLLVAIAENGRSEKDEIEL